MDLHIDYETIEPFPLERKELDLTAKKSNKKDKTENRLLFDEIASDSLSWETLAQPFTAGTNDEMRSQPVSTGLNESGLIRNEMDVKTLSEFSFVHSTAPLNDAANKHLKTENSVNRIENEFFAAKPKTKLRADRETGVIEIDSYTTLTGIPALAWEYKLGNRSALEWILDQYKEKKPKDATIAARFNAYKFEDYKEQVIDLLKRVTNVSVRTMEIVNRMPDE